MKLCVVSCLHGTEPYGLEVIKGLPASVPFVIGNPAALKRNVRFIETDLNRCFPGNPRGTYEERRAVELLEILKPFSHVIDVHSSSNVCPLFGIITQPNSEKITFAQKLGLKKLVIMPPFFASGKALIDYVPCGISLEIGPHHRKENVEEVLACIHQLLEGKELSVPEIFEVVGALKREAQEVLIENFQEVRKGELIARGEGKEQHAERDFIAVLVNEEAYGDVLCLMCQGLRVETQSAFLSP